MGDQLNMNGLSLNDSAHAPGGQQNGMERSAYIPPHMRGQARGPAPPGGPNGFDGGPPGPGPNGMNGSAWAPPQQK